MNKKQKKTTAKEKCLQRLLSLEKALEALKEAHSFYLKNTGHKIYMMALIQSFEFSFELSWLALKDFIQYKDFVKHKYARDIIKQAFNKDIIKNGGLWMDMLEDRNRLSHIYDEKTAHRILKKISNKYIKEINNMCQFLKKEI